MEEKLGCKGKKKNKIRKRVEENKREGGRKMGKKGGIERMEISILFYNNFFDILKNIITIFFSILIVF